MAPRSRRIAPTWIAVDWRESGMLAWALDDNDRVLMKARSAQGLAMIESGQFEAALIRLIDPWLLLPTTPVLVGGIADLTEIASQVPVIDLPHRLSDAEPISVSVQDRRLRMFALPGLRTHDPLVSASSKEPLARALASEQPGFDGILFIPGPSSRWLRLSHGALTDVENFVTEQVTELFSTKFSIKNSLTAGNVDLAAFDAALDDAMEPGTHLGGQFSRIWSEAASPEADGAASLGRLLGFCIGMEMAGARHLRAGLPVVVTMTGEHWTLYVRALRRMGAEVAVRDADEMALAGLKQAFHGLTEAVA